MTEDAQGRNRKRGRIALILGAVLFVLAALLIPPWISISRYKSGITRLISASLGRPVTLSSVELRLLPRPGFVLTDLTVAEDPAYGAEPVLHANTVTASIRLWTLWRGRMEISRISVDEASLNVVRASPGNWNLNSLLRTATGNAGSDNMAAGAAARLPYLEATNSRVNIKNGMEKLPWSLLDTDLSFWQEDSGEWQVRLKGQPARTDIELESGDAGTVRMDASMRRAPTLGQMPVHVDLEWSEGQMGQLARLITGSDPGWRGDVTGQLQLDGTPDAANVKMRLRATGVHRAEFAPVEPLDFDANCGFVFHWSMREVEKLVCDSPLGKGLVHLTGEKAGADAPPEFALELDRVPVAAGLGVLRTVRNTLTPDLEAQGTASGKLEYKQPQQTGPALRKKKTSAPAQNGLMGSLTVEGFGLSGAGLSKPLQFPRIVLVPAAPAVADSSLALAGTAVVAAGGATPLSITMRLALEGYQADVRGAASLKWARDLAHVTGLAEASALDNLAGDPITVDLSAQGRWQPDMSVAASTAQADKLTGTVALHNANWMADYLANHVEIAQATLHIENGQLLWDPVLFSYGPVKGTATLSFPTTCSMPPCPSRFQLQFGDLNASTVEAAFLGARGPNTLLSSVLARLDPTAAPSWPELDGVVKANSLSMGAVTLGKPGITVAVHSDHAELSAIDADLLGGRVHATGSMQWSGANRAKPTYSLEAQFHQLTPQALGKLLGESWSGGVWNAEGTLELNGFSGAELASSARGTFHFEWQHGAISDAAAETETVHKPGFRASAHWVAKVAVPAALVRFDDWSGDAAIANNAITLGTNQVVSGARMQAVTGTITLGEPAKMQFVMPGDAAVIKH